MASIRTASCELPFLPAAAALTLAAKIYACPAGADRGASLLLLGMLLDGLVNPNDTTALHVRCCPLLLMHVTE